MSGAPPPADAPPRAAAGEAPRRGHAGRFPRPRARYLALRASAAPPRSGSPLGVVKRRCGGAAKGEGRRRPGGGLKTRAARRAPRVAAAGPGGGAGAGGGGGGGRVAEPVARRH
ncbi:unnamed protein product [Coccothraustes coccothraustes]